MHKTVYLFIYGHIVTWYNWTCQYAESHTQSKFINNNNNIDKIDRCMIK